MVIRQTLLVRDGASQSDRDSADSDAASDSGASRGSGGDWDDDVSGAGSDGGEGAGGGSSSDGLTASGGYDGGQGARGASGRPPEDDGDSGGSVPGGSHSRADTIAAAIRSRYASAFPERAISHACRSCTFFILFHLL